MYLILAYILASLVGISLGLVGSGGAILTVPILVYIIGVEPVLAMAYSLFIVGSTALVGGMQNAFQRNVDFKTAAIFGIPSILAIYSTRLFLMPAIPNEIVKTGNYILTKPIALMILFAIVMIFASIKMIRPAKLLIPQAAQTNENLTPSTHYFSLIIRGLSVGILAGLIGAGGGFLIIPALVLFAKMPMKLAVGTSLFIVAANSLIGFLGDVQGNPAIDWLFLLSFAGCSVIGIFVGNFLSKKIKGENLKVGFGYFILIMGLYVIAKELVFKS